MAAEEERISPQQSVHQAQLRATLQGDATLLFGVSEEAVEHPADSVRSGEHLQDPAKVTGLTLVNVATDDFAVASVDDATVEGAAGLVAGGVSQLPFEHARVPFG